MRDAGGLGEKACAVDDGFTFGETPFLPMPQVEEGSPMRYHVAPPPHYCMKL